MSNERDGFLKALAENEDDNVTRLVYADWLDEHDEPEEADRQRHWAVSKAWLVALAEEVGLDYREILEAGHTYSKYGDRFVQHGTTEAQDALHSPEVKSAFWKHWQVISEVVVPEERQGQAFSCSC